MLYLNDNQLSGSIPAELGNMSRLFWLNLAHNRLTGSIPAALANPVNLEKVYLANKQLTGCVPAGLRDVADNDFDELGLPFCVAAPTATPTATPTQTATPTATATPTPTATATPDDFTSSGSGTESDPYIIADPTDVSARTIRSYVASLQLREYVYFKWEVGARSGSWTISTDATPTGHDFDLYSRDDQGNSWDDSDTSYDGNESVTVSVQANGHILLAIRHYDGGAPTGLTLTIEAPDSG